MDEVDQLSKGNLLIVVFGASGDLAEKKVYPALWSLHKRGYIRDCHIVGYARSRISSEALTERLRKSCGLDGEEHFPRFCRQNHYVRGMYDEEESFVCLNRHLNRLGKDTNRLYYMALPPSLYRDVAALIRKCCMGTCGWVRIVFEKPFGRDSSSSRALSSHLVSLFDETTLYRMDHYLGKEVVRSIATLRFANLVLSSIWNNQNIKCVTVVLKENFGVQGRAGYFDNYGIIRDVMQNHLLQILSLVAMEMPPKLADIREEKVKLLKCVREAALESTVIGQYEDYLAEEGVARDSRTPTMATTVLYIDNQRWAGVPFILKAGKYLNERKCEVRVQFSSSGHPLLGESDRNEFVMRVGPSEAIYTKMLMKKPGNDQDYVRTHMNIDLTELSVVDPYEVLILQAMEGDQTNFVRTDELGEAWRIFTPLLDRLEGVTPLGYEKGSRGPEESDRLGREHGFVNNGECL